MTDEPDDWPPASLPRMRTAPPGPASRALASRLRRVESRNVTHLGADFPVFWRRARGMAVEDADGNAYLDLTGAFGVAVTGHAHPGVTRAVSEQASTLPHAMGDVHPPVKKVELLERLSGLLPWGEDTRTVLATSGSEAVEIALKTALLATGRPGLVAFEGAYHGLTVGALAATARSDFREPFAPRLYPGVRFVPFPGAAEEAESCLALLDRSLAAGEGDPVGAVVMEPIQGRAGVRVPPPGFLKAVARRAREAGALLVLDEVFTGFGRTGALLACTHEGVTPDVVCLGKAMGGGLPLSACAGPRRIMDAWPSSSGEALHTSTFLGHPLACQASLAVLDLLEDEDLVGRARELGPRLLRGLAEGLEGREGVAELRGRGLFVGIALEGEGAGVRVAEEALRRGVLVLPAGDRGEVVQLSPPLVITEDQIDAACRILDEAVAAALGP